VNASGPRVRTRVKICGITRPEDGQHAAALGVDAIGLVFVKASPRAVDATRAAEIASRLPPFVTRVGLFVDAAVEQVEAILSSVALDLLQFHGEESAAYCEQFGRPYIKAVSMRQDRDVLAYMAGYPSATGFLLDAYHPAVAGGSGEQFDWRRVPQDCSHSIILAGGLQPGNVAEAIRQVRPYAVDVSTGVESAKGIKDATKMAEFMLGVQHGDHEPTS
jgi:phosphoribosylanthranilate isomerase